MINYDSILSAFDGKPTLLQWLKLVKKALDESVLKDITVSQDGASAVFTFNFEDGTSISTPAVTLPKGNTGAKGDKGDKGEQGVSVTGVDEVSNEVVGGQTHTTLRFNFSNGTNNEVVVHAENGKNGGKLYIHQIGIRSTTAEFILGIHILSNKAEKFNTNDMFDNKNKNKIIYQRITDLREGPPKFYENDEIGYTTSINNIEVKYFTTYPYSITSRTSFVFTEGSYEFNDSVIEL